MHLKILLKDGDLFYVNYVGYESDLNIHFHIHIENKLFQCKLCGKRLAHKSILRLHYELIHSYHHPQYQ
ncbi:unnamed protein product, partial [Timema podura]|nr:unnamed protein product [Timema podura]